MVPIITDVPPINLQTVESRTERCKRLLTLENGKDDCYFISYWRLEAHTNIKETVHQFCHHFLSSVGHTKKDLLKNVSVFCPLTLVPKVLQNILICVPQKKESLELECELMIIWIIIFWCELCREDSIYWRKSHAWRSLTELYLYNKDFQAVWDFLFHYIDLVLPRSQGWLAG